MTSPARRSKLVAADRIGELLDEFLADGDLLALGGLFKQGRPMGLVRDVIRSGRKDLKLIS